MINKISGIKQLYYFKPTQRNNKDISDKHTQQQNNTDVYIPSKSNDISQEKENSELFYGLNDAEWKELAQKYDVENLTREEKSKLLAELNQKGVLNEQEYRITNWVLIPLKDGLKEGGKITIGEGKKFDFECKNWLEKFDDIAEYCDSLLDTLYDDDSSNFKNIQNIRDIYLKIVDVFDKMASEKVY